MKIAIFTDTFVPQVNGVVRSILTTVNALVARGHQVAIFTMDVSKLWDQHQGSFSDLDERAQVFSFPSVTLPGFKHIQARIPSVAQPLRSAREFGPDIIHLHTIFTMGWEAICVAKLLKCPLVGSHHGFLAEYLNNFHLDYNVVKSMLRRFLAFYYNRCDAVITPAHALKEELIEFRLERPVYVVSNPINITSLVTHKGKAELKRQYDITRPTLVHVGRLVAQKSVDVLLKAFARLRAGGMDADLIIIGDGRERTVLERLANDLAISGHVTWTGNLFGPELAGRFAAADVFASASTTEVQPLVFLEAMALGLPVIGVRAGGVPEIVHHEANGLVVEPRDPTAMADAMYLLLTDPDRQQAYGARARQLASAYDADRVVTDFERVYHTTIGGVFA